MLFDFFQKNRIVLLLIIVTLAFRLPLLNQSFWLDEAAQALESSRPWFEQLNIPYDFQPPLLHIITYFMIHVSPTEWWLRLTSVIAGVITVVYTYLVSKKFVSEKLAFVTAALVASNSLHIFFSQELRPYSLACVFGVASWYFLLNIVENTNNNRQKIFYILTTLAGLYSTYLVPFLILSQILYVFFFRKKVFLQFSKLWIVTAVGFFPWLPLFWQQFQVAQQLRVNTRGWDQVVSNSQLKTVPLLFGKFLYGVIDLDVNVLFVVLTTILAGIFVWLIYKGRKQLLKNRVEALPLLTWLFVPLVTAWLISWKVPLIQPKRLLFLLPVFYLLLVWILDQVKISSAKKCGIITAFFVLNIFSTAQYWTNSTYQREDWRGLITEINSQFSSADTAVVFGFDEPFAPWSWYQKKNFATFTTGTATVSSIQEVDNALSSVVQYHNVLVFDYLRDLTDPQRKTEQWLEQYDYYQTDLFDYPNIGFIRVFEKGKEASIANNIYVKN